MKRASIARRAASRSAAVGLVCGLIGCQAFAPGFAEFGGERVRDLRDRAAQRDTMLQLRLEGLLPRLLEETGVDCWLVLADGHAGEPVLPALTVAGTRLQGRGALLLCDGATGTTRLAIGAGLADNEALYEVVEPSGERPLAELLNERLLQLAPARIAINETPSFPAADGLSATLRRWIDDNLAPEMVERAVSSRPLVERFLAAQLDVEAPLFAESTRLTVAILEEVLSDQVVVAAGTSLLDLEWAVRDRAARIAVELAYPPVVTVFRPDATLESERSMDLDLLLQPGDLVFVSAGVRYMGYANRVGRWAYLLPSGERAAPGWVNQALIELADAAEQALQGVAAGQGQDQLHAEMASGAREPHLAVARVGRLAEELAPTGWHPDYRLDADTGLALRLEIAIPASRTGAREWAAVFLDTALVTAAGTRFVVAPQRAPLLID